MMNTSKCEVCGSPAVLHMTNLTAGSSQRVDRGYCMEHAPASLKRDPRLASLVQEKAAMIDELPVSEEEKRKMRAMMRQMPAGADETE